MTATPLRKPFLESVRLAWERELGHLLSPFRVEHGESQRPEHGTVSLSEASAARVYRIAREVATTVGHDEPFTVYQTRSHLHFNGEARTADAQAGLRLIGPVVSLLDDAALAAMLGHEFGHLIAHRPPLTTSLAERHPASLAYSVACELTADRIGLLACQDLKAAVRLEVCTATGVSAEGLGVMELAHLEEVVARVEQGQAPIVEHTHPSPDFRLYAAWLFWRTHTYRELTSAVDAPADLSLQEVDARLERLLRTPELERSLEVLRYNAADRDRVPAPAERVESELERRFLELERRAAESERAHLADLERRFEELEKR